MNTPEWLKPGLYGAAVGAVALAIVGFQWGGWVTGGKASQLAAEQARVDVVAALLPICLDQSKRDPKVAEVLAQMKAASSYARSDMVVKTGWATVPGAKEADRYLASACADKLSANF